MYHTQIKTVRAKIRHRCTSCGEHISPGDVYRRWVTFDGSAFTNKMHPECLAELQANEDYEWEYIPYSNERPK